VVNLIESAGSEVLSRGGRVLRLVVVVVTVDVFVRARVRLLLHPV
jgi:hypothetical protein